MNQSNGKKRGVSVFVGAGLIFAGLLLLFAMWTMTRPTSGSQLESSLPEVGYEVSGVERVEKIDVKSIYKDNLLPAIELAGRRNEEAGARAIRTIREGFDRYRAGIPVFIEDLEGFGSKFTILSKLTHDKWNKWVNDEDTHESARFINEKFTEHIMSSSELQQLINDSITGFAGDLIASRNQMLAEMKTSLTSDNIPLEIKMSESEWVQFLDSFNRQLNMKLESYGEDAVTYPMTSLVAGELLFFGVRSVARPAAEIVAPIMATFGTWLVTSMSTMYATTAACGGGSTVICSMGGGAAGSSILPGFGTVVGFTVGLAVGYYTDLFFQERFEEKMTVELTGVLNQLENSIVNGCQDKQGLSDIYGEIDNKMKNLAREAVWRALYETKEN